MIAFACERSVKVIDFLIAYCKFIISKTFARGRYSLVVSLFVNLRPPLPRAAGCGSGRVLWNLVGMRLSCMWLGCAGEGGLGGRARVPPGGSASHIKCTSIYKLLKM